MGDTVEGEELVSYDELANNTVATYADFDASPTKAWIIKNRNPETEKYYQFAFGKRPSEELYDIKNDPFQMKNLAADPEFLETKKQLNKELMDVLISTGDPRVTGDGQTFERMPFTTTEW